MRELNITSRALAAKLTSARKSLNHTTVWAWTKNKDGYPPADTYTPEMNLKLAKALDLKPEILAKAYEDSRRHLILTDPDAASRGKLSVLRTLFATSKQTTWTSKEIVKLIDDLAGH